MFPVRPGKHGKNNFGSRNELTILTKALFYYMRSGSSAGSVITKPDKGNFNRESDCREKSVVGYDVLDAGRIVASGGTAAG